MHCGCAKMAGRRVVNRGDKFGDSKARNAWLWPWTEIKVDEVNERLGENIRKVNIAGTAFCELCQCEISYSRRGRKMTATGVPVGEDQIHHIELTRHLARVFNRKYGLVFPHCKALIGDVAKIRSLRNPQSKMSKSEANPLNRIDLTDTPDEIAEKIKKAVTDFTSEVTYDPDGRPGVSNLVDLHSALSGQFPEDICEEAFLKAQDTARFKSTVTQVVVEKLRPISERIRHLQEDRAYLEQVLETGAEQAQVLAEHTMQQVNQAMGLR
ncbi:hypothetical protein ACOMHN_028653 [Nucella lapillus]